MNKLLQRQLQKYFGRIDTLPENFVELLYVISESYDHFEKDRKLIERSIDISSREMIELNSELNVEKEELKKAHNELNTLFTNIEEVFFSISFPDRSLLQMSPACEKIYGHPYEAFKQNSNLWYDVVLNEDKKNIDVNYTFMLAGRSFVEEYRIHHKNGSIRWLETKISPSLDIDGKLIRVDGVTTDITKRKVAEEKVERNEKRFRAMVENVGDIISLTDKDGKLLYVSPAIEKILGFTSDEMKGRSSFAIMHPEQVEESKQILEELLRNPGISLPHINRFLHKNGNCVWVEGTVTNLLHDEDVLAIVSSHRDITERKKAEEKLKRNELTLRQAQEIAHIGSWKYDFASKTAVWSDEQCRIFGVSPDENLQTQDSFLSFIHPEDLDFAKNEMQKALDGLSDNSYYNRIVRKDGTVRYLYTETRNEYDTEGELIGKYGIMQDVTEQKLAEQQKEFDSNKILGMNKQLQQLSSHLQNILEEERTRIAREIHDELGQVIAVLKMDIGWVMHKQNKAEKEVISKLNEMLQFCDRIINTVRRISTELRPAIIDDLGLIASLEWKCSNFEETMGIPCKFISGVKDRKFENNFSITVFRILQETLTNVTRHADAKSVVVSIKEKEDDLIMQIIDDGTGIDNEHFDKCKTLGILGMKERAGLLGGDIVIRGEKNKGTRTKLILPF